MLRWLGAGSPGCGAPASVTAKRAPRGVAEPARDQRRLAAAAAKRRLGRADAEPGGVLVDEQRPGAGRLVVGEADVTAPAGAADDLAQPRCHRRRQAVAGDDGRSEQIALSGADFVDRQRRFDARRIARLALEFGPGERVRRQPRGARLRFEPPRVRRRRNLDEELALPGVAEARGRGGNRVGVGAVEPGARQPVELEGRRAARHQHQRPAKLVRLEPYAGGEVGRRSGSKVAPRLAFDALERFDVAVEQRRPPDSCGPR